MKPRLIIFSDLDGTFLDHQTYSRAQSTPALKRLLGAGAAFVINSSKTRAEIEPLLEELGLVAPFIVENGAAVFIPTDLGFSHGPGGFERRGPYDVAVLGAEHARVMEGFDQLSRRFGMESFSRLPLERLMELAGLDRVQAERARQREFTEPFVLADERQARALEEDAGKLGLRLARGGRFHHLMGNNDKGRAIGILAGLYRARGPIVTVGVGDSPNDEPMLRAVDRPFLVARPDGGHAPVTALSLTCLKGVGPAGFAQMAERLLTQL